MDEMAQAAELSAYEWKLIGGFACLSAIAAMSLAGRDKLYSGIPHLCCIGLVGGIVGAGVIGLIGHFSGGLIGMELLLLFVAASSGIGGRKIENALTNKAASYLGVDAMGGVDNSFDSGIIPPMDSPQPPKQSPKD